MTSRSERLRARELDCQTAFLALARDCVTQIGSCRSAAAKADREAIHEMRIALTRLRAIALFFPVTQCKEWRSVKRDLRWLNRQLGKARDGDVTAFYFRRKPYRHWARGYRPIVMRLRKENRRTLAETLTSDRYARLISEIKTWLRNSCWYWTVPGLRFEPVDQYSRARLRDWRGLISGKDQHLTTFRGKQLHRLRLRCKRYRYIVAALQGLGVVLEPSALDFAKTASAIHRSLGDLRDLRQMRKVAHRRPPGYRRSKHGFIRQAEKALLSAS